MLAANPFPHPLTIGFFYREKMRAIHRVAPYGPMERILEIGGGRGGLTALLYPGARITNVDLDPSLGAASINQVAGTRFVCADATRLPFADESFDAVTMFDVLEHIPDHQRAAAEARRVLRPGGVLLASSPHAKWRYPYYRLFAPIAPREEELFAEWGHVRRGYTLGEFDTLVGLPRERWATFISPVTAFAHDISFSRLSDRVKRGLLVAIAPITWLGYLLHAPHAAGTETAVAYRKPQRDAGAAVAPDG